MPRFTRLIEGYRRFREREWPRERERWSELAEGQSPKVMVIACADSRTDPAQIFDTKPGEIFVVRNIAALAPPYETTAGYHGVSSALEFGVTQLEVEEILVLGHGSCGGCAAALTGQFDGAAAGEGRFIANWVSMLHGARDQVREHHHELDADAVLEMEWEAVKLSLANLRTFPWIAERERAGRLKLHGAHFSIAEGRLYVLDEVKGTFHPA
ncbi:carbonic anhydrase [Sphingomonas sp. RG327]|jgi:carbonic anhydrase|uniref:carbonic anhydrase n=1 Tax=Sphingomonas anseongensis TaxID=2908207 RepID=A0ABT0RCV0_9SPHN|nr:carbonic anhydrase [Sphingomonas anseongensis]MCL6678086.1 carbonic anhydrase [Sphingomonas anseongensis]